MTCIAWDGKTLAADRQGTSDSIAIPVTKIHRIPSGAIIASAGSLERGLDLKRWYQEGSNPEKWPAYQKDDDWNDLIVVDHGKIFHYEKLPVPQPVESKFMAWGSGRDIAMGAMAMGADARKAVSICQPTLCRMWGRHRFI